MPLGVQIRVAESRDSVPLSQSQWNGLVAQSPTRTAFQTYEWFDTWWAAFGSRHRLFFLSAERAGAIIGFASMMVVRGPLGLRQLEFTGTPNADYQDFVLGSDAKDVIPAFVSFLSRERRHWDMIVLRNMPTTSPTVAALNVACAALGLRIMDIERQPCPALVVRGREREARQRVDRYSIRRALRKLQARGPTRFRVLDDIESIDRNLEVFFRQHELRWQRTRTPSPFHDSEFRGWYRELAHAAHRAGWLHFSVLECGGVPAAFHFGFNHGGVLSWYKPSYAPEFARESPGTTLIHHLIEDVVARDLSELDFAEGMEPFKERFSNTWRECLNLRIFSKGFFGMAFVAGARMRHLARRIWWQLRDRAGQAPGARS